MLPTPGISLCSVLPSLLLTGENEISRNQQRESSPEEDHEEGPAGRHHVVLARWHVPRPPLMALPNMRLISPRPWQAEP